MEKIKPSLTSVFFILLTLLLILSCFRPQLQKTQAKGIYHLVKKNETVWMIASAYNVKLQDLVERNNITDLNSIKEGSIIFIPDANNVKDLAKKDTGKEGKTAIEAPTVENKKEALSIMTSPKTQQPKAALHEEPQLSEVIQARKQSDEKIEPKPKTKSSVEGIQIDKKKFTWPVRGNVKTSFGIQPNKTYHNWIKIVSPAGTKVRAAASGTVIFSSRLKNYGETVIIRHKDNFATVYTHLKKRYINADQNVKKGETIAVMGETDDAGDTYINFEIRLQGKARNPLLFLP
ncbi:MAG: M23 family metallopeptidase [Smithella sp.]|jgi:lipoprotein NlpD